STSAADVSAFALHDALPISLEDRIGDVALAQRLIEGQIALHLAFDDEVGSGGLELAVDVPHLECRIAVARAEIRIAEQRGPGLRSEEHTSELQSRENLVCRL